MKAQFRAVEPRTLSNFLAGTSRVWRFAHCEFDEAQRHLRVRGELVPIEDKPLEVLRQLLLRPGEVITKEELLEAVWPGVLVVDSSLATAVSKLRKALGEDESIVVTRPRLGYQLAVPVQLVTSATDALADDLVAPAPEPTFSAPAVSRVRRRAVAVAISLTLLIVAGAAVAAALNAHRRERSAGAGEKVNSIAVLPLTNMSGDPSEDYLVDGITEALITELSRIRELRVISRTSVMRYKQARKPLPDIARELDVDAIVEGSVGRSGSRIRVTAQLIKGATDGHLWADSFDRELGDLLNLQRDVAREIAGKINVTIQAPQHQLAAAPVDPRAQELYLQGRYFWNRRSREDLVKAADDFEQAAAVAPDYALAYAGLADARLDLVGFGHVPTDEGMPLAKVAAMRAIALDDSLAEAHAALAYTDLADWDWAAACQEFDRALDRNPGYVPALYQYAFTLSLLGRHAEAAPLADRAVAADPLSSVVRYRAGRVFYHARNYERAREQFRRILELNPSDQLGLYGLGLVDSAEGNADRALRYLKQQPFQQGFDALAMLAASGRTAEARHRLTMRIRELESQHAYVRPGWVAEVYVALGERDKALEWLRRGYEERDSWLTLLKVWPAFDRVRSDPRYEELLRRMKFPEP